MAGTGPQLWALAALLWDPVMGPIPEENELSSPRPGRPPLRPSPRGRKQTTGCDNHPHILVCQPKAGSKRWPGRVGSTAPAAQVSRRGKGGRE